LNDQQTKDALSQHKHRPFAIAVNCEVDVHRDRSVWRTT
jgi:hypothetical protein